MSVAARKILLNTFSQVLAKIIIGGFSIIILKLLTTYLGKTGYGFYKSIYEFLALFAIVADMGLYTVGVREMSRKPEDESKILGNLMTIRTILIGLISLVAIGMSMLVSSFEGTIAPMAIGLACAASVLAILTGTVSTSLQVHLKMEWNSLGSVIGKIAALVWMILVIFVWFPHQCSSEMVSLSWGSGGCQISDTAFMQLIFSGVFGNLLMFLTTAFFAGKNVKISYRIDKDFIKEVILKSLPYGLALILNQIFFRIGSFLLVIMKGPDAVAIYSAPLTMLEAAGIIPLYFMNAILPFLTRSIQEGKGKHKVIIQYAFDFLMMASIPIVLGTIAIAYQLIYLIATPEFLSDLTIGFYGSDIILQILIVALFFSFLNGLFGYILLACDKQSKMLIRNLIGAIMTVFLTWLMIPWIGERGAAIANVFTEIYICIVTYFLAKKYLDFKLDLKMFWKILFCSLVMMGVVLAVKGPSYYWLDLKNKNILILLPLAALVYLGMLIVTKTLTREMIDMVRKKKIAVPSDKVMAEGSAVEKGVEHRVDGE